MKIDINNYEAFFLDFVEGRLDNSSILEMLAFLRNHPELKEELENFDYVRLEPSELIFEKKNILKKFDFSRSLVSQKNFDDFCIAYYEKLLTQTESEKLFSYLELNPEKKADFNKYGKAILKADTSITFEAKPFLKKKPKRGVRTVFILRWASVAAGIILAISIFYRSPVKVNNLGPKKNVAVVIKSSENKPSVSSSHKEQTKTQVREKKTFAVKTQINASDPSPEIRIVMKEKEDLNYLRPIDIVSVKSIEEVNRPELVISLSTITNNPAEELELFDYAQTMIKEKVLKTQDKPRKKLSLWDIADVTLKGYNQISEKDIILHRETDENGKLTVIAVETENRKYGFENKN